MPFELTPVELAEITILVAGVVMILAAAVRLIVSGRWREYFHLPEPVKHDLEPMDLFVACFAFFTMFQLLYPLWSAAVGTPAAFQLTSQPSIDTHVEPQKTLALITAQFINSVIFLLIGWYRFGHSFAEWGLSLRHTTTRLFQAVICYITLWPVCHAILYMSIYLHIWLSGDAPLEHEAFKTLKDEDASAWIKTATIISAVALAPIVEELLFRGLLLPALARWLNSQWKAVLLTGFVFGAIHFPLFHNIPALIVFGTILGYVYVRTRSLTLVILIHFIFNAKSISWLMIGTEV